MAGDASGGRELGRGEVSIHARAWRATVELERVLVAELLVSIHARAWRATLILRNLSRLGVSIHARAWRATKTAAINGGFANVSIHARAWRATPSPTRTIRLGCFNSRPRVAGDMGTRLSGLHTSLFQFTPARGGRRPRTEDVGVFRRFNSRPRVAGDICLVSSWSIRPRFNSRPRVAGDMNILFHFVVEILFQFTPARGGRPIGAPMLAMFVMFQFTPARGGRLCIVAVIV